MQSILRKIFDPCVRPFYKPLHLCIVIDLRDLIRCKYVRCKKRAVMRLGWCAYLAVRIPHLPVFASFSPRPGWLSQQGFLACEADWDATETWQCYG